MSIFCLYRMSPPSCAAVRRIERHLMVPEDRSHVNRGRPRFFHRGNSYGLHRGNCLCKVLAGVESSRFAGAPKRIRTADHRMRRLRRNTVNSITSKTWVCGMRHNVTFRDLKRTLSPIVPPLSEVYTHALILLLRWHRHLPPRQTLALFRKTRSMPLDTLKPFQQHKAPA